MKLVIRSVYSGEGYASVAELDIRAEAQVADAVTSDIDGVDGESFKIKEKSSGQYLHQVTYTGEGNFAIAPYDASDSSFGFQFKRQLGFTSFYKVLNAGKYLAGDGWKCMARDAADDRDGLIQLEMAAAPGEYFLRGSWEPTKYFNFDSFSTGSYVYADKQFGTVFCLEKLSATGISRMHGSGKLRLYPTHTKGIVYVDAVGDSILKVYSMSGNLVQQAKGTDAFSVHLNVPDGMYLAWLSNTRMSASEYVKVLVER